jgi:hypothetical protein
VSPQVTTQWKHKKGGAQLKHKKAGMQLKHKKLQQLHYVNTAQANAQVDNIFDSISSSEHGANNGMLQKRAQVIFLVYFPRGAPLCCALLASSTARVEYALIAHA